MRAGAFAEDRVINLLNRRFVNYFYNTGGPGLGKNEAAAAFVNGKVPNKWAFLSAFDPESGDILATSGIYSDKNGVFDFLMRLLEEHSQYAEPTVAECQALAAAQIQDATPRALVDAARVHEETGHYLAAMKLLRRVATGVVSKEMLEAHLALLRIRRYQGDWYDHQKWWESLKKGASSLSRSDSHVEFAVEDDLAVERGYYLNSSEDYRSSRKELQQATQTFNNSERIAELHFQAGLACFLGHDRDWAKFHWCWIAKNRPDDRLSMRAFIAAAQDTMPYPNAELPGFKAEQRIGPDSIQDEFRRSLLIYEALLPHYEAGRFTAKKADPAAKDGTTPSSEPGAKSDATTTEVLVRKLVDGNAQRVENNKVVAELVKLGEPAIDPLVKSINDPDFSGKGYAGWALGVVLAKTKKRPEAALAAIETNLKSSDPYVVALTRSGKTAMTEADTGTWKNPFGTDESK